MLRLPREWVMVAGLLATVPSATLAGPFDFLKPQAKPVVAGQSGSTNQQIANDVAAALKEAKLKGFDINIEVKNGVAKLTGKISDPAQKALATKAASQVEGVTAVDNQLELATAPQRAPVQPASHTDLAQPAAPAGPVGRSNQQVAQQIANSLVSAGLGQHDIEVRYKDGGCSLAGNLDTPEQALTAYQLAASVPEVKEVLTKQLTVGGRPFNPSAARQVAYQPAAMQQPPQGWQPQPGYPPGYQPGYQPGPGYPAGPPQQAMAYPPVQQAGHIQQAGFPGHGGHNPHFGSLNPHEMYNSPNLPEYAWPTHAAYDNSAAVTYPSMYDASAWPYIGPFYPYPQVPLGWRSAQLVWDDGYWNLKFNSRTDKWWWFLHPENWD
ncbi:MAG: BON domain-containing protein [Planctomycetaceae bacterium]|nr:BON domain-containing protein [Planctomycetaceae bacterium]